jgi:hypothetical protein
MQTFPVHSGEGNGQKVFLEIKKKNMEMADLTASIQSRRNEVRRV